MVFLLFVVVFSAPESTETVDLVVTTNTSKTSTTTTTIFSTNEPEFTIGGNTITDQNIKMKFNEFLI